DVDEEVETLDELKKKKKEQLEEQKKQDAENQKREAIIEKACNKAEVDITEAMVNTELEQMIKEFEQRLQMQGMTMEMYYQFSGQDENALKEQMREDAQKRVKTNLTLEAIVNEETIEVSQEDVDAELEKMASMYGTEVEQLKQMLGGNTDALKEDLKFKKAIDFLIEHSKSV